MKAHSYCRWSSEIQSKGDSLTRQLEVTRAICKEKGWELVELKPDRGVSAFTGSNIKSGSLAGFLKMVDGGKIRTPCVLVVEQLDRLTRTNLHQARRLFEGLLEKGVSICTAKDGKVYDVTSLQSPMDLMTSIMELKAANDYVENISRRVKGARKRAREAAVAEGKIFTRSTPRWVTTDATRSGFGVDEGKADIVRRIFKDYANGKGLRTIMRELNAEKIPSFGRGKQNRGNGWSNTHIRRLLCFRGVLGEYQPHIYVSRTKRVPEGNPRQDYYPAIVDKATFYKVQDALKNHTHKSGCKRNATNLFTGLVKCAKCGASMVIKQSGTKFGKWAYVSLFCDSARRGNGCEYRTIQYHWIERAVLTALWTKVLPVLSQNDTREQELTAKKGELNHVRTKLQEFADLLTSGEGSPRTYAKVVSELETKETTLAQEIEALAARMEESPLHAWKHLEKTVENRLRVQSIVAEQISNIKIDAGQRRAWLTVKNPDCEFVLSWGKDANTAFAMEGEDFAGKFPYVDDLFVWKTPQSIDSGKALESFKETPASPVRRKVA